VQGQLPDLFEELHGTAGDEVQIAAIDANTQLPIRVLSDVPVVVVAIEIDVCAVPFDSGGGLGGLVLDLGLTGCATMGRLPTYRPNILMTPGIPRQDFLGVIDCDLIGGLEGRGWHRVAKRKSIAIFINRRTISRAGLKIASSTRGQLRQSQGFETWKPVRISSLPVLPERNVITY
jgi:hypothetical protein